MDIDLANVVVHIDETLDQARRRALEDSLRAEEGVVSVGLRDDAPHLMVVAYNPRRTSAQHVLERARSGGLHAELVGL